MWMKFSLRSLFVVTALVGSFLAGRMPPAKALREAGIERDIAQDRLKRFQEQLADSLGSLGCAHIPSRLGPVAIVEVDEEHISIAAGSDDGLNVSHRLDVRHNNLAVASVRVVKTDPDRALVVYCRPEDQGRIVKGDSVYWR